MKEVTYEDWLKNPTPRMMSVWKDNPYDIIKRKVIYMLKDVMFPVVALDELEQCTRLFRHCAEIEEPNPKYRRMTNKELAWWLRDGMHREYTYEAVGYVHFEYTYFSGEAEDPVDDDILIRENGGEWREPLVEVEE